MAFELYILGYYASVPNAHAISSAQFLNIQERYFLIDCAEGTQMELRKKCIKFNKINNIFISHLHGDHIFGLVGFLSTLNLLGRTKDIHIYAPKGLDQILYTTFTHTKTYLDYKVIFKNLEQKTPELIFEDDKVEVHTIPLKHSIYTNGFLFKEKPKERKLNIARVQELNIPVCYYRNIKLGKDYETENGEIIPNEDLSFDASASKSYAYCSDTKYNENIVEQIKGVDVIYHEATFLEKDKKLAQKTFHTTVLQAGKIAKLTNTKKLILGHFSLRYNDLEVFKNEAQTVFENVVLASDKNKFEI